MTTTMPRACRPSCAAAIARRAAPGVLGCALMLPALPAAADDPVFGYTTLTDVLPKGGKEVEFWLTRRSDKGSGTYRAYDPRVEFEYGFTDRLMGAFYLNGRQHRIAGVPGFDDRNERHFDGVSAELKYQFLSPYKDGFGLGLYIEPEYSRYSGHTGARQTEYALETKLLLQKNFLEDQLIWAGNVVMEFEREKAPDEPAELENKVSLLTGLSYRFAPNWYGGIEARYASIWPHEGGRAAWAVHAGPALHYGTKGWWATLTWLPQLKGKPNDPALSSHLHLDEFEKNEIRLRVGFDF